MSRITSQDSPADLNSSAVFVQNRERIQRYIRRVVKNPVDVEDLLQETFLRVHRQLPNLKDPTTLTAWLYRIATNVCYDHLRSSSRLKSLYESNPADNGETAEARWPDLATPRIDLAFQRAEMSACIRELVERFNDDYRFVLLLHDVQGLTNPEIAEVLQCSLETVKIRLHRARKKLRAVLVDGCDIFQDDQGVLSCDPKPISCEP